MRTGVPWAEAAQQIASANRITLCVAASVDWLKKGCGKYLFAEALKAPTYDLRLFEARFGQYLRAHVNTRRANKKRPRNRMPGP